MFEIPSRSELVAATTAQTESACASCSPGILPATGHLFSAAPPALQEVVQLPAMYREIARMVRAKYRHLYELPVIEYADGSRSFHEGRLYRRGGLNVLLLRGDYAEMAFQHGRLLADEIPQGTLPQSSKLVSSAIANALGHRSKLENKFIDIGQRLLSRRMFAASSRLIARDVGDDHTLVELMALSDATGVAIDDLVLGLLNPELLMVVGRLQSARLAKVCRVAGTIVTPLCCSSFAAWGNATVGGDLLIGRNMDYPLNGFYDRFPTVIYFEPPAPALRFMSFVSAGVHNAGVTSYNEAGLFLASHVVPSTDVSLRGVPAIVAADLVIRRANSFDSAEKLFRQLHPSAGWSYLLASVPEGKVGSLEMSAGHVAVRPAVGEYHIQTNHYLSTEMRDLNLFINRSVDEDSEARAKRISQRLMESTGRLDTREVLSILGDQVDPQVNEVRGLGNTVGVHTTMNSVMLDAAHGRVFVSSGRAPACHSEYVELPLIGTFDRDDFANLPCHAVRKEAFRTSHPEKVVALETFIRAKIAYETKNDVASAYQLLKDVVRDDPSNPAYYFQLGVFALKNRLYDEAQQAFDSALRCSYLTDQLRRLIHYYRGRTWAQLGKAKEAQADLAVVLNDAQADEKLRTAARRAARWIRIFGRCSLSKRSLAIMMQQSDMLTY